MARALRRVALTRLALAVNTPDLEEATIDRACSRREEQADRLRETGLKVETAPPMIRLPRGGVPL